MAFLSQVGGQFVREVMTRSLRGSLLIGGTMLLLSNTGMWQYMRSSFSSHDVQRAAHWSAPAGIHTVGVAIDVDGYEHFFGGRSPLDPARAEALLSAVAAGAGDLAPIIVDLDLAPTAAGPADKLVAFFAQHAPGRWVLADPGLTDSAADPVRVQWKSALCRLGVRFGHPYVPFEFGAILPSHQYRGSLAEVAAGAVGDCEAPSAGPAPVNGVDELQRVASPLASKALRDGASIPFQGDLGAVESALKSIAPQAVVVGGTWAKSDLFLTPFGERYGLHLHAAAFEGRRIGLRLAPYWIQFLFAYAVVTALSLLFGAMQRRLQAFAAPWDASHPGHAFLMKRMWPLAMSGLTMAALLLVAECSAFLLARTGLWLPSVTTAVLVGAAMLFTWNWGQNDMSPQTSVGSAWRRVVTDPVRADWSSLVQALARLRDAGARHAPTQDWAFATSIFAAVGASTPQLPAAGKGPMSAPRALIEALLATASLLAQTLLPLLSLTFTFLKNS